MIDAWDETSIHSAFELRPDINAMQRTVAYNGDCSQAYGVLGVKRGDIKTWKLQLLSMAPCGETTALIGIIDASQVDPQLHGDFCNRRNNGYGISCFQGRKYFKQMQGFKYCDPVQVDDVITIE